MVDLPDAAELDAHIFAGYVDGLRQASWHGDERRVRLGYTAEMALKMVIAYLPGMLWGMLDHSWHADYETQSGSIIAALADAQANHTRWLLLRGLEALDLARQLG